MNGKKIVFIYDDNNFTAHGSFVRHEAELFRKEGVDVSVYTLDEFQSQAPKPEEQFVVAYLVPPVPCVHRFREYPPLLDKMGEVFGADNVVVFLNHEYTFCADDVRKEGFRAREEIADFPSTDGFILGRLAK